MRQGILLLLLLASCSYQNQEDYQNTGIIEEPFQWAYNRFIYEAKIRGKDISGIKVEIVDNPNLSKPGICYYQKRRVEINLGMIQKYTSQYNTDWYFDFVINHELAHCILQLRHSDSGLMIPDFPFQFFGNYWIEREKLLNEIFQNKIIFERVKSK